MGEIEPDDARCFLFYGVTSALVSGVTERFRTKSSAFGPKCDAVIIAPDQIRMPVTLRDGIVRGFLALFGLILAACVLTWRLGKKKWPCAVQTVSHPMDIG